MEVLIVICISVVCVLFYFFHKKNIEYIKKNSICLNKILNLNSKQNFKVLNVSQSFCKNCNSKPQFDNFNIDNYMNGIIDENLDKYIKTIDDLKYNRKQHTFYQNQFNSIMNDNYNYAQLTQNTILNEFFFKMLEKFECERIKLKPALELIIYVSVFYTSPKGKNHYNKRYKINSNNVEYYCSECLKTRRYKQSAKYQRALMTDKLRYQVLCRDGHRCVLCGASAKDGVKLHVDHIIPVSKGGKTELSNLRTLCERCNLGKGASYNPNGYN